VNRNEFRIVINDQSPAGRDLARMFLGFVTKEFGADSFALERIIDSTLLGKPSPQGYPPFERN
jgi:hypothetical protein